MRHYTLLPVQLDKVMCGDLGSRLQPSELAPPLRMEGGRADPSQQLQEQFFMSILSGLIWWPEPLLLGLKLLDGASALLQHLDLVCRDLAADRPHGCCVPLSGLVTLLCLQHQSSMLAPPQ